MYNCRLLQPQHRFKIEQGEAQRGCGGHELCRRGRAGIHAFDFSGVRHGVGHRAKHFNAVEHRLIKARRQRRNGIHHAPSFASFKLAPARASRANV